MIFPWQSYTGRPCHMASHCVTCCPTQVSALRSNSRPPAGTRFTYPGGMEGWVGVGCPATERPGVELATSRFTNATPNKPPHHRATLQIIQRVKTVVQHIQSPRSRTSRVRAVYTRDCFISWWCDVLSLEPIKRFFPRTASAQDAPFKERSQVK